MLLTDRMSVPYRLLAYSNRMIDRMFAQYKILLASEFVSIDLSFPLDLLPAGFNLPHVRQIEAN